jgi:hypothetical protein
MENKLEALHPHFIFINLLVNLAKSSINNIYLGYFHFLASSFYSWSLQGINDPFYEDCEYCFSQMAWLSCSLQIKESKI